MKKSILVLMAFAVLAPAAALAQGQEPIRVGATVKAPERVRYVPPVYPDVAEAARVQGIVIMEAVVSQNGDVTDAKILKSIPLLDQAALDAVRQWRYTPTTLNGTPVPVIMTVTVNFAMDQAAAPQSLQAQMAAMESALSAPPMNDWKGAQPIRVGGNVSAPERVSYFAPVYPEVAQQARVSGVVIIEAIIDENGNVAMTKVLKSIPLLDEAATAAVSQWKYTPTLLNGVAVPVIMTVTVNFTLQ